ncbi:alcohol dehydrogenase [Pleurotus pulmonarius]|nr:alcohol dehydrogenase [Pleurotus pulmonarius]KAF4586808.1 alcohol dehydrogenase [Pleurotus pulmonarius]
MQTSTTNLIIAASSIFVISRVVKFINGLKAVNYLPGYRIPFWPLCLPGAVLPTTWWNVGMAFPWRRRFDAYRQFNNESFSIVPWLVGPAGIYTSNIDVGRQVIAGGHKTSFIKPEEASQALLYGIRLPKLAAEGDTWRKHRRVMGPAFNNSLYNLVWEQTFQTYREMIQTEGWADKDIVEVPTVQKLTFKLALLIIGHCAFGFPFDWSTPAKLSDGSMSVQEALRIVADTHMFSIVAPNWIYKLPVKWIQETRIAHEQLAKFMRDQVADRKQALHAAESDKGALGRDAFSMLVAANESENEKLKLSDQELIGNVFVMLFAGHETTAHTLAATLGFMGLYEDIQEDVFRQIVDVVGLDRDPVRYRLPTFPGLIDPSNLHPRNPADNGRLPQADKAAGHLMIREACEDTTLSVPNPVGQEGSETIPVPKGTQVVVDMVGVQYNPRYFKEPEKFNPARWEGVSNESESFTAFSVERLRAFAEVIILREPTMPSQYTIPKTQKAAVVASAGASVEIKEVPVKTEAELAPGECLVKLHCTGVCHTDLHAALGDWPLKANTPLIGGHEGVGEIVAIGPNTASSPVKIGDRVGIKWLADSCLDCEHCRKGREQNCLKAKLSGFNVDGTFSEYVVSYVHHVTPIPDGIDSNSAASILCAGVTVYRAIKYSQTEAGDWIVLPGAGGGLGHLAVQYARVRGLRVIAIDSGEEKKKLCLELGAEVWIDFKESKDIVADVKAATGGEGAHSAVVTTASPSGYTQAVDYLRGGGTLMVVGLPGQAGLEASIFFTVFKSISILGSYVGNRQDAREAVDIAARGQVKCVYVKKGLPDLKAVYEGLTDGTVAGRVVLDMTEQ